MTQTIVVEDNDNLREDIVFGLNSEGIQARGAADGKQLAILYAEQPPDVLVLDILLAEDENGLDIARRMREEPSLGIIMMTCLGNIDDRVFGLDHADAYLVKPVDIRELAAVIRSVHRHTLRIYENSHQGTWLLCLSRLALISPDGTSIDLTYRELTVLRELVKAQKQVVPTKMLVNELQEDWLNFDKNRLELIISHLRNKIMTKMDDPFNPIKAARNQGYVLGIDMVLS